ncbi:MAG: DUF5655 domain-containing protein [Bacteroidota bacterium]
MATPEEMLATQIANIEKNTGKSMADWVGIVHAVGKQKHREIINWLKAEHGFTYGNANLVATYARQAASAAAPPSEEDLVEAQYAGGKAGLRPIYDALINIVKEFGAELVISPKKTYVSLRRKKQFALIQPSTKTRVDLGINLKGREPEGKVEDAGKWNGMVSHRVRLTDPAQVDAEVAEWLKAAFDAS